MLSLIVFLCGAAVMVLELVGSRLLAPWLGASLVVWTGLIGVVLACLALGAWLGGMLADRRPQPRLLASIILAAGVCTLVTALGHTLVLELAALPGVYLGVVLGGLTLFGPASVLLGMVPPFAVRLAMRDAGRAGRTAGRLYALSTLGSIAGTFLSGFVLMAHVGSTRMLLGLAATLGVAAALAAGGSRRMLPGLAALLAGCLLAWHWTQTREARLAAAGRHELDTSYSRVLVFDAAHAATGRPVRVLATGPGHFQSAMFLDRPDELLLSYTQFFTLAARLAPAHGRVLTLGGGAGIAPRAIQSLRPDLTQQVVELDPGVTAAARSYFGLPDEASLAVTHQDARMFLRHHATRWDVILLDVFDAQYAVPFHLASLELATLLRERLQPDGWVLMNTIGSREGAGCRLVGSVAHTFRQAFPWVGVYAAHPDRGPRDVQNLMLVAGAGPLPAPAELLEATGHSAQLAAMLAAPQELCPEQAMLLTDEFAPTEHMAEAVRRELAGQP